MSHLENAGIFKITSYFALALGALVLLTGCEEANLALDKLLGKPSSAIQAWPPQASTAPMAQFALKREPGERPPAPAEPAPGMKREPGDRPAPPKVVTPAEVPAPLTPAPKPPPEVAKGKKRQPGERAPAAAPPAPGVVAEEPVKRDLFRVGRDPFKKPTEILPSECPPSMPLCRFDYSQLKLVGVIQVSDGQFKGLVEDPDGRGYFIAAGTRIGGATVTQVTNQGATLYLSKTKQDVPMPLFQAAREISEQ